MDRGLFVFMADLVPDEDDAGSSEPAVPARASPRLRGILERDASELVDGVFEDGSTVSIHDLAFESVAPSAHL